MLRLGDVEGEVQRAFPPARVVVEGRDAVEAELGVVVGADPLRGVDRALLQRGVDVAAGDLLRHHAELGEDLPGDAGDAHLEAVQVPDGLDLLAEPAAHLRAGVAARDGHGVVAFEERPQRLAPAARVEPGVELARVHAEGDGGVEGEGRVLADEVVGGGVRALHRAGLHRVRHLEARHQLAGLEHADLELVVRHRGDALRDVLRGAVDGVEGARERAGAAPPDLRRRLRQRRRGERRCAGGGDRAARDQPATIHGRVFLAPFARGRSARHRPSC